MLAPVQLARAWIERIVEMEGIDPSSSSTPRPPGSSALGAVVAEGLDDAA
jgi:hypothetical protein